jgi:hypothetical protein
MDSTDAAAPTLAHTALLLTGADALSVLHRVGTQKLDDLAVGEARLTLFCDFRGRMLHGAVVSREPDGVWLLRDDAPAAPLATFLDRQIFREDVQVLDRTSTTPLPERESEAARIRAGHARHGHEITDEFTPYEANLADAVHLDKGCFTGQESLMRLLTYDSVRRQLVCVRGQGALPELPSDVLGAAGEKRGRLTSAAADEHGWIALAVLRIDALEAGEALTIADGRALAIVEAFQRKRPLGRP